MSQADSESQNSKSKGRPSTDKLFERISSIDHLPTLPAIIRVALSYLEDSEVSISSLARLIEEDQSMAARILKVANSAYYARSGKIGMIREAVLLLGLHGIRGLILSMSVLQLVASDEGVLKLWKHSFAVSILSRMLGEHLSVGQPEDLATAGLLHDFGKVIYYLDFEPWIPDLKQKDPKITDWRFEEDLFGASHAFVGFRLAYFWHFPSSIRVPIGWHNNPSKTHSYQLETAIVALADALATLAGYGLEETPFPESTMFDAMHSLDLKPHQLEEISLLLLENLPKLEAPDF